MAIDAVWLRGWANWREYWMKACTSALIEALRAQVEVLQAELERLYDARP